ncbi:hypothetical protein Tco_1475873 [Tanacetum coccineum]
MDMENGHTVKVKVPSVDEVLPGLQTGSVLSKTQAYCTVVDGSNVGGNNPNLSAFKCTYDRESLMDTIDLLAEKKMCTAKIPKVELFEDPKVVIGAEEPVLVAPSSSYATKLSPTSLTKANLRKLEANVPNDADYDLWLPLASVHKVNDRMVCA